MAETEGGAPPGWLARNWLWILGGTLLAAVLVMNVATLTSAPQVFGDEAWVTSIVWSASEGHGYEPALTAGAGLYEGVQDFSSPRVALLPNLIGELLFPTSVGLHRGIVLILALGGLGFFWNAMRKGLGGKLGLIATATLASTWAFFYLSHFIRWDGVGLLILCALLSILVVKSPRVLLAGVAGLLVGLCLDFSVNVASVFPGVLLLCAWERDSRWHRLGALVGGVAAGALVAAVTHLGPSFDVSAAREQTDMFLRPQSGYLDIPMFEALKHLSLGPLLDDPGRYDHLTLGSYRVNIIILPVGLLAAILSMLRWLDVPAGPLRIAGLAGIGLVTLNLLFVDSAYTVLGDVMGPLLLAAIGTALWLAFKGLREDRPYPAEAVPAILLTGLLLGWALIVGFRFGVYTGFGVVLSVGAIAFALRELAPERMRETGPALALAAATVASGLFVLSQIDQTPEEPALDSDLARTAQAVVPEGDTVIGEWVYWWLYKDERFRINSVIWQQSWNHPDESFEQSFHRVCPDYVLLDTLWLGRYLSPESQRNFPNLSPIHPKERGRLKALLRREYRVVEHTEAEGRTLAWWKRTAPGCPEPDAGSST